ncbi:MAG: hypothetical protein KatS3mg105_2629 [Gemmatales bacterium]|nr:MAG: hypothetical protein KatS3mg105_2629 [Gemmatales bacterium]
MAKQCEKCHKTYDDELTACPHCAAAQIPPAADSSDPLATVKIKRDPQEHVDLGVLEAPGEGESAVDLGALYRPEPPPAPPGTPSSPLLGREAGAPASGAGPSSESLLAKAAESGPLSAPPEPSPEKATHVAKQSAPATQMAKQQTPATMLAQEGPLDIPGEEKPDDPKKTGVAAGAAPPTMLAEGDPSKMTQLAPSQAQQTMLSKDVAGKPTTLVPPDQMDAEARAKPMDPKATQLAGAAPPVTQLATGAAAPTKLAKGGVPTTLVPPDDMEALLRDQGPKGTKLAAGAAHPTQLGAGAAPTTKLVPPDEMDALAREQAGGPKATKLAAGAAPHTTLAGPGEMEALAETAPIEREEAIVTEEISEAVAEEEPIPMPVPKKATKRILASGVFGMLVGSAAVITLAAYDILPMKQIKGWFGIEVIELKPGTEISLEQGIRFFENREFTQAIGVFDKIEEKTPEVYAYRGRAVWLRYLDQKTKNNQPFSADDSEVGRAKADLQRAEAKVPEAKLWLGQIEETVGTRDAAKAIYLQGKQAFPQSAAMFETQIMRIDSAPEANAQSRAPGNGRDAIDGGIDLFFVMFQEGGEKPKLPDEAGYEFWRAAQLLKENKFDEAIKAMENAREIHKKQRYLRLPKAQNPKSDPTEQIFIRAADELITYLKLRKEIYEFSKDKDPLTTLKEALIAAKQQESGKKVAALIEQLKKRNIIADGKEWNQGVEKLLNAYDQWDAIRKALVDAKKMKDDDRDVKTGFDKLVQDYEKQAKELKNKADSLTKENKKLTSELMIMTSRFNNVNGTLQGVVDRLAKGEPPYVPAKTSTEKEGKVILAAVDKVIDEAYAPIVRALGRVAGDLTHVGNSATHRLSKDFDLAANLASSEARVARLRTILLQSRTPHQMLDIWIPFLEQQRENQPIADRAALDAANVLKDAGADPETHHKAYGVQGLAQRNLEKFDDARKSLALALKGGNEKAAWRLYVELGLNELTDPNAYYLPRTEALRQLGEFKAALSLVNRGLKAFPAESKKDGELLALRSLVKLDLLLSTKDGVIDAKDEQVVAATKDAQAAIAAGAVASGHYSLGRIAEETRDYASAEKNYRQAIAAHKQNDDLGGRYRLALARVLLKKQQGGAVPRKNGQVPPPKPVGARPVIHLHPVSLLTAAFIAAQDDEDEEAPDPRIEEAIKLAEEAIRAGNLEGHLIKALALGQKKMWNAAVLEYVEGLARLAKKPERAEQLRMLIENHPAFKIPDGLRPPNPMLAERHYAHGLRHYWARRYRDAEKEFLTAVSYYDQDARFMYYLGLARLAQGKQELADNAFKRGGLLEAQNKPGRAAISNTLERIQGRTREHLNRFRP